MNRIFISLKCFIVFICFWMLNSCSQNKIDYRSIRADADFSCDAAQQQVEIDCGLDKICRSKNKLEIRLAVSGELIAFFQQYVLTNNDSGWTVTKYETNFNQSNSNSSKKISQLQIEKLFDTLKQNHVFTLPDQKDLKVPDYVDDGAWYSLTFKIEDKFRRYEFNNPDVYKEHFVQIKEFQNYSNIVKVFDNIFQK